MKRDHLMGVARHPALAAEHDQFAQREARPFALGYPFERMAREEEKRNGKRDRKAFEMVAFEICDHGAAQGITEDDCDQTFQRALSELHRNIEALATAYCANMQDLTEPAEAAGKGDIFLAVSDALGRGVTGSAIREMMVGCYGASSVREIHCDRWPALLRDLRAMRVEGGA